MSSDPSADFSGLADTPEHLKFDESGLAKFMADNVEGFGGSIDIKKFKGGQSNPTYLLTTPDKKYVLRRKPPGKLLPSAHAVEREYKVMTALGAQGFPAPKTYALCEDADIIGTPFFIMDFVEGRIFWDSSLPEVAKEERAPLFYALVDTLADLILLTTRRRVSAIMASRAIISNARSAGGRSSISLQKLKKSKR